MSYPSVDEIVFEHRNKAYGAYNLRKIYVRNVIIGLSFSLLLVFSFCVYSFMITVGKQDTDFDIDPNVLKYVDYHIDEDLLKLTQLEPLDKQIQKTQAIKIAEKDEIVMPNSAADSSKTFKEILVDSTKLVEKKKEPKLDTSIYGGLTQMVDSLPKFMGHPDAFRNYLVTKIQYPDTSYIRKMKGKLLISFIITQTGQIDQIKLDNLGETTWGKEVIRIVKLSPPWQPAYRKGKPVKVFFSIPVLFAM